MTGAPPQVFRTVEAGRGLAALAVVLFHAASLTALPRYWGRVPFGGAFGWGYAGVFFFFVLSGFIIVHVHGADIGRPARLRRYLARRMTRIYPVYWVVLGVILAAELLHLINSPPPGPGVLLSSLALVGPDNQATVVAGGWTLYHEIAFYLLFAAWIGNAALGALLTLGWGALIATGWSQPAYLGAPVNLLFGYGVAAWWLSRRRLPAPPLVILAVVAFAAVAADVVYGQRLPEAVREQLFGLAAAAGLAGVVAVERARPVAVPAALRTLGAASYSIYLIHYPALSLVLRLLTWRGLARGLSAEGAFLVAVPLALGAGFAVHRLIERPLLAALGRPAWTSPRPYAMSRRGRRGGG